MIKTLFKKQLLEVFSWVYRDAKSGKRRSVRGIVFYCVIYLFIFGMLGFVFGIVANTLCKPLLEVGMGWLYWCIMGLIAIFLGVFGSVFNTYSSLYLARDNELLLSMPIPTRYILSTRLFGVYAVGLMYELLVMLPTIIIRFVSAPIGVLGVVNSLIMPLLISFFVLVLSALLGFAVAAITVRLKRKNLLTVLISVLFIAAYYYFYGKAYSMLRELLENAVSLGGRIRAALYPLYHMGMAAEGSAVSMLIFTAMIAALLALTYLVLSRTFLRLATAKNGGTRGTSREKAARTTSVRGALLRRELLRFTGSANYMLNCGLGCILMPLSVVLLVWKADVIVPLLNELTEKDAVMLAICAICTMSAMNDMTASSISLEGKNLWIIQSLPISGRQLLLAKLELHLLLTVIPALFPMIAVELLLRPSALYAVLIPIVSIMFIAMMGAFGLFMNLKLPNLEWSSEIVPIKQGAAVTLTLFGSWAIILALAGIYLLLALYVSSVLAVAWVVAAPSVTYVVFMRYLMTKGGRVLERL